MAERWTCESSGATPQFAKDPRADGPGFCHSSRDAADKGDQAIQHRLIGLNVTAAVSRSPLMSDVMWSEIRTNRFPQLELSKPCAVGLWGWHVVESVERFRAGDYRCSLKSFQGTFWLLPDKLAHALQSLSFACSISYPVGKGLPSR